MDNRDIAATLANFRTSTLEIRAQSLPGFSDKKSFHSVVGEQLKMQNLIKKSGRKVPEERESEADSNEELKAELEDAVRKYKKNIKKDKRESNTEAKTSTHETNGGKSLNVSNSVRSKTNRNKSGNSGDSIGDVMELINFFFSPQEKSYSDYKKQGAVPKKNVSNRRGITKEVEDIMAGGTRWMGRSSKSVACQTNISRAESVHSKQMLCPPFDNEIMVSNEETCFGPFFYIVPENPCPKFFLPRGSYYVIPKVPSSSSEERLVFHPEGPPRFKREERTQRISEIQSNLLQDSSKMNNLDKEMEQRRDSHLNISPLDVKLNDSFINLVTNCSGNKIFDKALTDATGSTSPKGGNDPGIEFFNDEPEESGGAAAIVENPIPDENKKKLHNIRQRLLSEFPDLYETSYNLAEMYLHDELRLESFITSERLKRKINNQLEVLVSALPESSYSELRRKCEEFQGDEEQVRVYIEEKKRELRINQRVVDLQLVLPDADFNFLRREVEKLGDTDHELNSLTEDLLLRKDYPKISDYSENIERRELWMTYVKNFNVQKYLRSVPQPEHFAGAAGDNNKADLNLIFKYLKLRYRGVDDTILKRIFRSQRNNLTRTCNILDLSEEVSPLDISIQNEAFTEEFLKEICFIEHKKEIVYYLTEMHERKQIEITEARLNGWFLSCPLCADDELLASEVVTCPEGHVFCKECVKRYVSVKIGDGVYKFSCLSLQCVTFFTLTALEDLLPEGVLLTIAKKQQAEEIRTAEVEGLECCPRCEFAYIPNPESKIFKCQNPACSLEICRKCGNESHIPLRCEEVERQTDVEARKKIEETMTEKLIRICPSCKKKILKIDGCNKIQCSCGALFCYYCRTTIQGYSHFRNRGGSCPLFSNNEELHHTDVVRAGIQARDEILRSNPQKMTRPY